MFQEKKCHLGLKGMEGEKKTKFIDIKGVNERELNERISVGFFSNIV
jgi:hypothetical protein